MRRAGVAAALGVLCAVPGPAAAAELPRLLGVPLQVSIPVAPVAFRSNGQSHLAYEKAALPASLGHRLLVKRTGAPVGNGGRV